MRTKCKGGGGGVRPAVATQITDHARDQSLVEVLTESRRVDSRVELSVQMTDSSIRALAFLIIDGVSYIYHIYIHTSEKESVSLIRLGQLRLLRI